MNKGVVIISSVVGLTALFFVSKLFKSKQSKIVDIALKYVEQSEIYNDKGFNDKSFETEMKSVGWQVGQPWCAYFVKLVISKVAPEIAKQMNGSSQSTYANLAKLNGIVANRIPKAGAIVVWQSSENSSKGHLAIVHEVKSDGNFITIDGNSGTNGKVTRNLHNINEFNQPKGKLILKQFLHLV